MSNIKMFNIGSNDSIGDWLRLFSYYVMSKLKNDVKREYK